MQTIRRTCGIWLRLSVFLSAAYCVGCGGDPLDEHAPGMNREIEYFNPDRLKACSMQLAFLAQEAYDDPNARQREVYLCGVKHSTFKVPGWNSTRWTIRMRANPGRKEVSFVVAVRGSVNYLDWARNAASLAPRFPTNPWTGETDYLGAVAVGFHQVANNVMLANSKYLKSLIEKHLDGQPGWKAIVNVAGHSQGAAAAGLVGYYIAQWASYKKNYGSNRLRVHVTQFSGPETADMVVVTKMAKLVNEGSLVMRHFHNRFDAVPSLGYGYNLVWAPNDIRNKTLNRSVKSTWVNYCPHRQLPKYAINPFDNHSMEGIIAGMWKQDWHNDHFDCMRDGLNRVPLNLTQWSSWRQRGYIPRNENERLHCGGCSG